MLNSCQRIESYKIKWSQKLNTTCYHQFPVTSDNFTGVRFLELKTRRIFKTSHKILCNERPRPLFIKDIHGVFWKYLSPNTFERIIPKHYDQHHFVLNLPKLATFNVKLRHYASNQPHRTTLLSILAKNTENLEILSHFNEVGHGNIIVGVARAVSATVKMLASTGEHLFDTIAHGVVLGIKTISNTTEDVIDTSSNGLARIFHSIGIPNLILYVINFCIIIYLVLMRFQITGLKFLFPPNTSRPPTMSAPTLPPRVITEHLTVPEQKPRHQSPLPHPAQV